MTRSKDSAKKLNLKEMFAEQEYPYLVLDARSEQIGEDGVIRSQAVLVATGINWDGRRCVPGVEMATRESQTSWKEFLEKLRRNALRAAYGTNPIAALYPARAR